MARGKAVTSQEIKSVLSGETSESSIVERVGRKLYVDSRKGNKVASLALAKFSGMYPKQSKEKIDVYSDADLLDLIS